MQTIYFSYTFWYYYYYYCYSCYCYCLLSHCCFQFLSQPMRGVGGEGVCGFSENTELENTIPKQQSFITRGRSYFVIDPACGDTPKPSKRKVSHSCHDLLREHSWTSGNAGNQATNVKTWRQGFIRWQRNNLLEAICGMSKAKQGSQWTQGSAEPWHWKEWLSLYLPVFFCLFIRFFHSNPALLTK